MARVRRQSAEEWYDRDLSELPPALRWREWMLRVEAVIFASPTPVDRETLARVVGGACNLDALIDDIQHELADRPYELVKVAGGWQHRTRARMAGAVRASGLVESKGLDLSEQEALVLMAVAYFQPVTRGELGRIFGKEISRDLIGDLRGQGLIAAGPRSPQPGAPYTYVTTDGFLSRFGFNSLRDLPDFEKLEDAGLLSKERLLREPGGLSKACTALRRPNDSCHNRARACLAVQSVPARQFGCTFQSRFAPLSGSDRGRVERRLQSMTASILRVQRWCAAAGQRNTFRADPIGQLHHPDIHLEPIAHLVLARKNGPVGGERV